MQAATIKHLYNALETMSRPEALPMLYDNVLAKVGKPPKEIEEGGLAIMSHWLCEVGESALSVDFCALNYLRMWKKYGCQVFSLSEAAVDLMACTKAPLLGELAPVAEYEGPSKSEDWRMPYPAFAFELPYPAIIDGGDGPTPIRCGIAGPFWNNHDAREKSRWDWVITTVDWATKRLHTNTGKHCLHSVLTNLCTFLAEGGTKRRAPKRTGYERRAKAVGEQVNIWKIALETSLPLGIAREFLESGKAPGKTFRTRAN